MMLLLCALIVGSGSVWAVEEVYKTCSFSSTTMQSSVSSYSNSWENIVNGFTWTINNFNNNNKGWNYIKCGSRNAAYTGSITTKTAIDEAITKVVVTIDAIGATNVNSFKLYTSSNGSTWTDVGDYTKATGSQAVTLSSPTANLYYKVEIDCKKSSNGLVQISKVEYYHNATVVVTGITLNKSELSLAIDETETLTATVTPDNATDKTVTWSSSSTAIADVDATGKVTAKAVGGPVTITATANDGSGVTATCTVNVIAARVDVTGVELNKTATALYVGDTETLTATVTPDDATNKNVTWSTSNADVATVENGVITAIGVGTATITVTTEDGDMTATCAVTVNPVAVTGVELNKTTATVVCGKTETLTATIAPTNATNKNVTWASSNDDIASVEDGVVTANAVGTATITVTTEDGSKAATCVVTVEADATKPELSEEIFEETFANVTGTGAASAANFDNEGWTVDGSVYGYSGDGVRLGKSGGAGSVITPALTKLTTTGTLTFKARGWNDTEKTIKISGTNCTVSPTSFTDLTTTFADKEVSITVTGSNPQITFTADGTPRVIIDEIVVFATASTVDVTLNASGFASYCSPFALNLAETADYKAYAVKAIGGNTVKFTKIQGKVAANTPFVLYNPDKASEAVSLPIIEDGDSEIAAVNDNDLRGTLSPTYVEAAEGYTNFGLSGGKFVKMTDGVVKKNKAYLPVSNSVIEGSGAREFSIVFDDGDTTGIDSIDNSQLTIGGYYNLNGQRVAQPAKGLYIVNGRKVVIR